MLNYYLLGGLIVVYFITSMVNGWVRDSSAELPGDVRERVFQSEAKLGWLWRAAEFVGFAMILAGMFRPMLRLPINSSLTIAGGLLVFCASNTASAWYSSAVYGREAPNTSVNKKARLAAIIITLAEMALIGVVLWMVSPQLKKVFGGSSKNQNGTSNTESEGKAQETGTWIPESEALKELKHFPREYVEALVKSGKLETKTDGGKTLYNLEDVEVYKKKKPDVIPD